MAGLDDLRATLRRIDGRGYKTYRDARGSFESGPLGVHVDHVQGDPFAAPSLVRVRVRADLARMPAHLFENSVRRVALEDFLARCVRDAIDSESRGRRGSGKSGAILVDAGGQEVLERSAVVVDDDFVEVRLKVGLPAAGRRILGREAERLLCDDLPRIAERSLVHASLPSDEAARFVDCVENQAHLRACLADAGLVAFVGDGAVLPRATGASDLPLSGDEAVPFASPAALRVRLPLRRPIEGEDGPVETIAGMGVARGVTLIVGGGYHGKSTLLRALERGVYDHVPGDGRECVVSAPGLVKVRAEDGRRVERVDISALIADLPQGRSTASFTSDDASGSTSQASSIVEAIEAGATGLLLDEDTSATNFMIRDARMQALVDRAHEPITPFLDRVREFHDALGVSTVLVMGGCGDYFDVADRIVMMRDFQAIDATDDAKRIASEHESGRRREVHHPLSAARPRIPEAGSFDASRGRREVVIDARGLEAIDYGTTRIDLRGVEQLVDTSQTRAVGLAIHLASERFMDGRATLAEVLDAIEALLDGSGLDVLDPFYRPGQHPGDLARPRRFEIAAAINRLRTVRMRQAPN
jgi:predicted ABC-class ATPase